MNESITSCPTKIDNVEKLGVLGVSGLQRVGMNAVYYEEHSPVIT